MRRLFFLATGSAMVLVSCGRVAPAGWGAGGCGPVGPDVLATAPAPLGVLQYQVVNGWIKRADVAGEYMLCENGFHVGSYNADKGGYRPLRNGSWGALGKAPVPLPQGAVAIAAKRERCGCSPDCGCGNDCRCAFGKPCCRDCRCLLTAGKIESDGTRNFGLDKAQIDKNRHILNGRDVSKGEMMRALKKASLPDDAGELCVTVIGPETARRQALADLKTAPSLAPWRGKVKVQGYDPAHWSVRDAGFKVDGVPTIYIQAADGKVLHRQDEYRGPEALAEALRKADPSYNAAVDPDLNKTFTLSDVPGWLWAVLGAGAFLLLTKKGN